jgi:hypothetical protein
MNVTTLLVIWAVGYVAAYAVGYFRGRDDNGPREKAWAEGFAAGLARADEMRPSVNRWEMR